MAFPQDGYYRAAEGVASLNRALDMGVDIVGGIPHFERTMDDGRLSVEALCRIAADRGLPVDMHCDETDDPLSAPCRDAGRGNRAVRVAGPGGGVASDLDAFDGQLLCLAS